MIKKIYRDLQFLGPRGLAHNAWHEIKMLFGQNFFQTYAQNGEDIVIDNLLGRKKKGTYVDIGAYDPTRFSNSNRFYKRGWKGINIEPDPKRIKNFYKERSRDTNLNIGIANKNGVLKFYKFEPNTLSTFSKNSANTYKKQGYNLSEVIEIPTQRIADVLSRCSMGKKIDFFSIDTEGFDLEVLKSNDWKRFQPRVICVEAGKEVENFLSDLGYKKVYQSATNSVFVK